MEELDDRIVVEECHGFFLGIVVCCLSGSEFIRSVFKGLASLYKQQRMMKRSK